MTLIWEIECGLVWYVLLRTTVCIITVFKMLLTRKAQPRKSTTNFEQNIILCHNLPMSTSKKTFFLRARPRSWHKERASVVYNFLAIWLVYCPKWAFQIISAITTRKNYLRWLHLLSVFGKTFCFNFGKRSCCHFECIFSSTVY